LNKALAINISIGNPINLALNYAGLGIIYRWKREHRLSIEMLEKGIEALKPINNKYEESMLKNELILTYSDERNYSKAEEVLQELIQVKEEVKQLNLDAYIEYSKGYYLKATNKNDEALVAFRNCRKMSKKLKMFEYYILSGLSIAETLSSISR